jgi:hypothetical protein
VNGCKRAEMKLRRGKHPPPPSMDWLRTMAPDHTVIVFSASDGTASSSLSSFSRDNAATAGTHKLADVKLL